MNTPIDKSGKVLYVSKETDAKKVSSEELAKAALAGKTAVVGVVKVPLKKDDAIKVAEAHLVKVYGKKVLEQRPWIVSEKPDRFCIKGTFHKQGKGGVAEIEIAKADGKIIKYTHGK